MREFVIALAFAFLAGMHFAHGPETVHYGFLPDWLTLPLVLIACVTFALSHAIGWRVGTLLRFNWRMWRER